MKRSILISALLLYSLSWISVSGSDLQTVEVQPGQEATLLCSNISKNPTQTDWFRVVNRTKPTCIFSMYGFGGEASPCPGFENGKFEMSSNISTVFLKIERVDLSDSGMYFCGFYINMHTVISTATHLNIQGDAEPDDEVDFNTQKETNEMTELMSGILGCLSVFLLLIIIVLAVKNRKLKTAMNKEVQPERKKKVGSDDLNYAALTFQAKPKRNHRHASERNMEPNVVYATTKATAARSGADALSH
uniref:uncharacterized protein LOC124054986 n=1 Tax=Scatophagus argus TaxID=75038 RepID=UPI001ED83EDE|nr:uncharacterized protein LOC124054986 [Scatophagus argus]